MGKTPEGLLVELAGIKCQCGRPKQPRKSFCRRCYFKLPLYTRNALYRRFRDGYEQAYEMAIEELQNLRKEARDHDTHRTKRVRREAKRSL